ncbi:ferrous iron transporter B [Trueperella pecoris]|uniref:Ferrous iron transporter B n=2 Tax=Trueperella pecoris TaxID=2733571 RepID=A0A7M1R3H3_9ACTO|nr:ferrous iron transporter B [Trueperella pecoris]
MTQTKVDDKPKNRFAGVSIALVGNPNVGKSTLFNGVTGSRQAVVNAPGTTVEVKAGTWKSLGARILDLPGTYSLIPNSPDEKVVSDTLAGTYFGADTIASLSGTANVDLVLAVLDGGALTRSLYLVAQLAQTGYPVAAVIHMADVAADNGVKINPSVVSRELGIPVMVFDPRHRANYASLDRFVEQAILDPKRVAGIEPDPAAPGYNSRAASGPVAQCHLSAVDSRDLLAQTSCGSSASCGCGHEGVTSLDLGPTRMNDAVATPLAVGNDAVATPPAPVTPSAEPDSAAAPGNPLQPASEAELERATTLFGWVDRVESAINAGARAEAISTRGPSRSDRVDRVLLNPFVGPVVFFAVMWFLFKLAGEWVGPIQDRFDAFFTSDEEGALSVANGVGWLLSSAGLDGTWVESLLINGLVTGLGVVASFVPLMFVIFAALSILEDSGYMARAAFLADRLMRRIGLDGRVVLPLIMGFGCNLPSLAAARTLPSAAQRLVTVLITPYTSCAARLTIYLMIAKIFFPANAGTVVFAMYVISLALVVVAAWGLKHFFTKHEAEAPLMLILPAYQVPRLLVLTRHAVQRSWVFVKGAGKIIVAMTMVVWLLGAIPMAGGKSFADPELAMEDSAYGQVAKVLEPVFEPAGFGDWHMTGALMTGFVAKETVVSSIVASYNMDPEAAGDAEDNGDDLGVLPELLGQTFTQTAGEGLQGLAAIAFLVFVLAYTPCLATVAEQAKLIGSRRTTIAVVVQLLLAWALAVGIFQIGKLFL